MKRYVCTVATGLLLALVGTGTATAGLLPTPGQDAIQVTSFGDQTVGEQKNDADVTQAQGNGNLSISPAVGIFGDAETTTVQGSDNEATADVDQSNSVDQTQSSTQRQSLEQSGGSCCDGQSQAGEQKVYGGDQTVEKQRNDADVDQYQGNGNVNVSPAIGLFGNAETTTVQGSGNEADASASQWNEANQSQSSTQRQYLDQDGGSCCNGRSQTGEQKADFGDQYVGKQRDDADVNQFQGNGNLNISPAISVFGGNEHECRSKCEKSWHPFAGDAETTTVQGSGNTAHADVDQSNSVDHSQTAYQRQCFAQEGRGGCCKPSEHSCMPEMCSPKKEHGEFRKGPESNGHRCCSGPSQTGEQKAYFGDQTVEKQRNDADLTQKQGNWNGSFAPALGFCGDAETKTVQGSWNEADAGVHQSNSVDQMQTSYQRQSLVDMCKGLVHR